MSDDSNVKPDNKPDTNPALTALRAAKEARAAEYQAIRKRTADARALATEASVSPITARKALIYGIEHMRSRLTKERIVKASAKLGLTLGPVTK